jgi:hypothetical protein
MKLLFLIFLFPINLWAYPQFISHGYVSCLNCHYNPFGGGTLNDYGRMISATVTSSRLPFPSSVSDEQLANHSSFFFTEPLGNYFRPQLNYRGIRIVQNPWEGKNEQKTWVNMQMDGRLVVKAGDRDQYIASMSMSRVPRPRSVREGEDVDRWRSREHYIGVRPIPEVGIYAGLMDKVYGLRVVEHTAFSRVATQNTMNDQTHGIAVHGVMDLWEGGIHGYVGNLDQDATLRMKGASFILERTIFEKHRLGISGMRNQNDFLKLNAMSVIGRFNVGYGVAINTEIGEISKVTRINEERIESRYGLLQTSYNPARGLYFFTQVEYYLGDTKKIDEVLKIGPGIQYFPIQRLEFRADLTNTRPLPESKTNPDNWMLLLQTHLWL